MAGSFAHLHLHTQYSLLDGANKIPDVLIRAHSLGQSAIAITDHGNLHGALEFYQEAKKIGIKPIIGCELYVTSGSRFERKSRSQGGSPTYHLTVLARDLEGYRNLCKLVTLAYKEGFYFKPRVDFELLRQFSQGLIVLSGCLNGELSELANAQNIEAVRRRAEFYASIFKDNFYLEVQPHQVREQELTNAACREVAASLGLPLVATNDCHYLNREDHHAQEVLMCISTGKLINDPSRMRYDGLHLHLKTVDEMRAGFGDWPLAEEAIANAVRIADQCQLEFDFSKYYMPVYRSGMKDEPGSRTYSGGELVELMSSKARQGLAKRLETISRQKGGLPEQIAQQYWERLEEEIKLIEKMGFAGYFLVVADFIVWAKEHGIPVGPGRGSVAGSLVAYAMRITEVDPIEHKLLFERFLNPERVSLPDIDVDFCIYGRDRVIQYVVQKYGAENVAQIATFGTMKAKAAIKDVGRVLGISYAETDRIAQLVPAPRQGFDYSLAEALRMERRLADYAQAEGRELIELALKLEGLTRHSSTHAAGVVIGDRPLVELLPMMVDKDGNDVTQFAMTDVEKIGLVKFDFLGLKTLTVIQTALSIIKESRGIDVVLELLPLDDAKTYALLCAGNTTGVFQLESSGITEMTVRLKPSCFNDLVAILALYRPGPLDAGMVEHYIERKHGREAVIYLHPLMKSILSDTYGIILYQEQIMQLARELAGYSLGEADLLRKAMGKKIPEEMAKQRERFITGASARGINRRLAGEIFDQMETFARYGFNRSHSAAYAMISYQTAYLKAHYHVEFMAALMSHEMEDSDKTLKNLNECRKCKIAVLPPDVNKSIAGFSVREGRIRYGLEAVKGIGEKAVLGIVEARKSGPFRDFEDFMMRVDLHVINKRVVENLIKCGAFDFSGVSRAELMERLDDTMRRVQAAQREKNTAQVSLFGDGTVLSPIPRRSLGKAEWPINKKLAFERQALGFYISGHPLERFVNDLKRMGTMTTSDLSTLKRGAEVRIGGVVTALKLKNTKKGDRYATFVLEDWLGTVESIVWPDVYRRVSHLIVADDPVLISGRADVGEERRVLIVDNMDSLIALRDKTATEGVLDLRGQGDFDQCLDQLVEVLRKYRGNCPVKVRLEVDSKDVSLVLKDRSSRLIKVQPSEGLCEEVEQLFGRPVLSFMYPLSGNGGMRIGTEFR